MNSSPKQPNLSLIDPYRNLLGAEVIDQLFQIASLLKNKKIVHINSTKEGGGVAEILHKLVPLSNTIGIDSRWEVMQGNLEFFQCTKMMHNLLQGRKKSGITEDQKKIYEEVSLQNSKMLRPILEEADIVFIHDPQPAALLSHFPKRKGKWIWRCHIDLSMPSRTTWRYLRNFIDLYDASVFSLEDFVQPLSHPSYLIAPSIDPFSEKNITLDDTEISTVFKEYAIDRNRPTALQVSRFDPFKDPFGVIKGYKLAKRFYPDLQLILAGGEASDDPEGKEIYQDIVAFAKDDPDIHVLLLPSNAHRTINALQRGSDIVIQKSIREGFGLTVTEALWKGKAVIGGHAGGIKLQVVNHNTGFLVHTPEGVAHRIRYLLHHPEIASELGLKGQKFVKDNFLITRHLREYITLMISLLFPNGDRINI